MLRTNDKKVKNAVQKYILECAKHGLHEYIGWHGITSKTIEDKPMICIDMILRDEMGWKIEKDSYSAAFREWVNGLCPALPVHPVYYDKQRELLQKWTKATKSEMQEMDDIKVNDMFLNLIWHEFNFALLPKEQGRKQNGYK